LADAAADASDAVIVEQSSGCFAETVDDAAYVYLQQAITDEMCHILIN